MTAKGDVPGGGAPAAQPASRTTNANLNTVGFSKQRERMCFFRLAFIAAFPAAVPAVIPNALHDMPGGDRAIRADVIRDRLGHAAEHGAADLHRVFEVLGLHAPGAVVAGAALDRGDGRAGDRLEQLAGLLP